MSKQSQCRNTIASLFARFSGQNNTLVIPRPFIDLCGGDHLAALLLSQILYWSDRTTDTNGWFAKSYEEWHDELAMSEYQVRRAIKGDKRAKHVTPGLEAIGVEVRLKPSRFHEGAPTLHYRVDMDKLQSAVLNNVKNGSLTMSRTDTEQTQVSYTEITSETIQRKDAPNGVLSQKRKAKAESGIKASPAKEKGERPDGKKALEIYSAANAPALVSLATARRIDLTFQPFRALPLVEQRALVDAHKRLAEAGESAADYAAWLLDKYRWRKPPQANRNDLLNDLPEFLSRASQKPVEKQVSAERRGVWSVTAPETTAAPALTADERAALIAETRAKRQAAEAGKEAA